MCVCTHFLYSHPGDYAPCICVLLCCVVLCCVVLCYVVLGASPYPTRDCPWPDFETREQLNMVELLLTDGSAIPKVQMDLRAARIKGYDEASQQGGAPQNGAI